MQTSYARIFVYMNIPSSPQEAINPELEGKYWIQTQDYEHIPFRCMRCHVHENLFFEFPLNEPKKDPKEVEAKDSEGFTKIPSNKHQNKKINDLKC